MIRSALLAALVASLPTFATAQDGLSQGQGAILRALDKISGQSTDLELASGTSARFGRITVTLQECRFPAGNPSGEAYAGLLVLEDGKTDPAFRGWMIASAPALSAMDHARYDVWVIRCTTA